MKPKYIEDISPGDMIVASRGEPVFYVILGVGRDRGYTFISYAFGHWKFVKFDFVSVNQCFPTSSWVRLRC